MKKLSVISAALLLMFVYSCRKDSSTTSTSPTQTSNSSMTAARGNTIPNMQAYYDSTFFTIKLSALAPNVAATIIAHNGQINNIYTSDDLEQPQTYHPVLDAIPGDGMNPNWLRMEIVFNNGFAPHQFYRDDAVIAAQQSGEINLVNTGEIYICGIVGH